MKFYSINPFLWVSWKSILKIKNISHNYSGILTQKLGLLSCDILSIWGRQLLQLLKICVKVWWSIWHYLKLFKISFCLSKQIFTKYQCHIWAYYELEIKINMVIVFKKLKYGGWTKKRFIKSDASSSYIYRKWRCCFTWCSLFYSSTNCLIF